MFANGSLFGLKTIVGDRRTLIGALRRVRHLSDVERGLIDDSGYSTEFLALGK